jgi:quercetin dioxygenase-like cupin family protein
MSAQLRTVAATDGEHWTVLGQRVRGVLLSEHTDGRMAVCEIIAPPGDEVPLHVHQNEDETFSILEGQLEVYGNGTWKVLSVGDTAFLPRGIPHTFRNTFAHRCRFLAILTPGGFEGFFREVSELAERGPLGPEIVAECAANYGLAFLSA